MTEDNAPRLMGRKDAAKYCGIADSTFSMWVATLKMPPPVPGTRKWDRKAIDARLNELSGLGSSDNEDPYEKWERENRQGGNTPADSLSEWREKKEKRRAKHQPQMGLDAKHERVLLFMADHSDCDTTDMIPGAGPVVMQRLVAVGALKQVRGNRYELTEEGRKEAARIRKWRSLAP